MGKFFSLWSERKISEPRLKKPGMEGKLQINHKGHEGTQRDCQNCQHCQRSPKLNDKDLPWISAADHSDSFLSFVFLRVLCGYFFFFLVLDDVSGCAPVTLAST